MQDHYKTLGLNHSASDDEIRRAYRTLARRYHPDVNPGKESESKFKKIAEAYQTLSNTKKRRKYDAELEFSKRVSFEERIHAYKRQQRAKESAMERHARATAKLKATQAAKVKQTQAKGTPAQTNPTEETFGDAVASKLGRFARRFKDSFSEDKKTKTQSTRAEKELRKEPKVSSATKLSIIEVAISIEDAIKGVKKTVEISEPEGERKIAVSIPPGVQSGSIVRLRASKKKGRPEEELVIIVRLTAHPFMSMGPRGLIVEVPITVQEALLGASIQVPSLEDSILIKVPAQSKSGTEVRVREKGIQHRDGSVGDLIYRLIIQIPDAHGAVGFEDKVKSIEQYYQKGVRQHLQKSLLDK